MYLFLLFTKSVCFQEFLVEKYKLRSLVCRYFEITLLNVFKWKCLSQKSNSCFTVFPGFGEGKEGERKMREQVRCQVCLLGGFLIEDFKMLVRFNSFVCVFSYPKHAVYQCLQ